MRTFLQAFRFDLTFQFRHGFYYAYGFITLLYSAVLFTVPSAVRSQLAAAVIYSDPSVLGFFFMAGIYLMERQQGTLPSLLVTPLGVKGYILSKTLSLAVLSVLSGSLIAWAGHGSFVNMALLIAGIAGGAVFFTLVSIALVSRAKNLSEFLAYGPFILLVPALSLLPFVGVWVSVVPLLLPGGLYAALVANAMGLTVPGGWVPIGLCGILWTAGAYVWAQRAFENNVVKRI